MNKLLQCVVNVNCALCAGSLSLLHLSGGTSKFPGRFQETDTASMQEAVHICHIVSHLVSDLYLWRVCSFGSDQPRDMSMSARYFEYAEPLHITCSL